MKENETPKRGLWCFGDL